MGRIENVQAALALDGLLETSLALLVAIVGAAVALAALYLVLLAVAAFFHRERRSTDLPESRLVVLVPAHNEAALVGRCVRSLREQHYPHVLYSVIVVADNCSDDTAARAAEAGAQVMVRDQPDARGKGHALRWAMDRVVAGSAAPDAVVVVDADSVAEQKLLSRLAACFEAGAEVVQGEYLTLDEEQSARSDLRAAAFLLFHRVRFAGRAALHLPCHIVGNGMLFSTRLLAVQPWTAFTSAEDLEFSVDLRLAGVRPVYAGEGRVRAPVSARGRGARTQRLRWEGGRFHVARTRLPELMGAIVRQRRWSLLDVSVDLAVPPLGLLALFAAAGTGLAATLVTLGVLPVWTLGPWLTAVAAIPTFVILGLWAAHAPARTYRALSSAPLLICSELLTRLRLVGFRATTWERTERPGDRRA